MIFVFTGHKNPRSIEKYVRKSDAKLQTASKILSINGSEEVGLLTARQWITKREWIANDEETEESTSTKVFKLSGNFHDCMFNF